MARVRKDVFTFRRTTVQSSTLRAHISGCTGNALARHTQYSNSQPVPSLSLPPPQQTTRERGCVNHSINYSIIQPGLWQTSSGLVAHRLNIDTAAYGP